MLIRLNNLRWWAKLECASREKVVLVASLFVFFLAWTCSWAILEADRSLHFDVLEAYAWGREFQLGYDKHGPFWSWVAGAWFSLFPNTNTCFVLLEASNATLGLLGAWRLNGLFVTGRMRDAAVLLLLVTPFYTFQAYKYNANTIFISLWPWTLFFFVRSLDKGRKWDAALFGVFAAALLLSKYYAVVLLLTCALALPFHEQWRRYILSPLPWIAGVVFAALALPHLIWTIEAGAPTVAYAISKTGKGWFAPIIHGGQFLIWVALSQSGVLLIIFVAWWTSRTGSVGERVDRLPQWRRRFLAVLVLAPFLLTVFFGLAFELRIETVMAVGLFPLMPLLLMQLVQPVKVWNCFRLAGMGAVAVTVLTLVGAPVARAVLAKKSNGPSFSEPQRELAEQATSIWRAETHTRLRYAGSSSGRYANAISFYSKDRPSSFVELDYMKAPWVTPAKLKRDGLLIACVHSDQECIGKAGQFLQGTWTRVLARISHKAGRRRFPETEFDIFIIPPQTG